MQSEATDPILVVEPIQSMGGRFYESAYPDVDKTVVVQVRKVTSKLAYVALLEYNGIEGMIKIGEVSKKRIRTAEIMRVGSIEVCLVMSVDKESGHIELSRRRVDPVDVASAEESFAKAKAVHLVMQQVAQAHNIEVEDICKQVSWLLYNRHGSAYEAFQECSIGKGCKDVWTEFKLDFMQEGYLEKDGRYIAENAEAIMKDIEKHMKKGLEKDWQNVWSEFKLQAEREVPSICKSTNGKLFLDSMEVDHMMRSFNCRYCGIKGHKAKECRKKELDRQSKVDGQPRTVPSTMDFEHSKMESRLEANAYVNETLLRMQSLSLSESDAKVVLLKFSRRPATFREGLLQAPELEQCRKMMKESGLDVELDTGAKIFVKPWQYAVVIKGIELAGIRLRPDHVVVDPEWESAVMSVVRNIPGKAKISLRSATSLPTAFAATASQLDIEVSVRRTFLSISIPVSTCSSTEAGPYTVSTTQADARKGQNPRAVDSLVALESR